MVLLKALVTEKSVQETAKHRFTFAVVKSSTKIEIKAEVEKTFGVNVVDIHTVTMRGKAYRTGKKWRFSKRPDWKKAIVTVKPDQKIDLFEVNTNSK
jgi:large subunit ribosomal protein L23